MRTTSSRTGARRRIRRAVLLGAAAAAALSLSAGAASSAQADPFHLTVDHAVIDLGALTGLNILDSGTGNANFDGTIVGNQVTIPASGVQIPPKSITDPIPVTIQISANSPLTGTYDASTGAMSLNQVSLRATTSGAANCVISPIVLTLSTANVKPYIGEAFTTGLTGPGAVDASWSALPAATGDGLCALIGQVAGGEGGIWLSHLISTPKTCSSNPSTPGCATVDPCTTNPKATGCPGNPCTANPAASGCPNDPCKKNSSAKGCPNDPCKKNPAAKGCSTPKPAALKLTTTTPRVKVKARKAATFKLKVANTGGTAAKSVKVCVTVPKALKAKCKKVGTLAAGASKRVSLKVSTTNKARKHAYRLNFIASGSNLSKKSVKVRLTVR
jgi:hypothetical protein